MARMPKARWVGEQSPKRRMSRYDIVCVHTIVGWAPAHAAHFSVKLGGEILQSRDTLYQSAANLNGNPRVLAIENEDGTEWWNPLTDAQVRSNAEILAWAHQEHSIPLWLCPNSRPGAKGLAYHRQGINGNFDDFRFGGRVTGGELWTEHFGKVCPGDNKIAQLPEILDQAKALVSGKDEDMPLNKEDKDWIRNTVQRAVKNSASQVAKEAAAAVVAEQLAKWNGPSGEKTDERMHVGQQLNQSRGYSMEGVREIRQTKRAVKALAKSMGPKVEQAVEDAFAEGLAEAIELEVRVKE